MTTKALFREIAPDYSPKNDPWGYAMGAFFDVAAECYNRTGETPREWRYRPSPMGATVEDEYTAEILAATPDAELLRLGHFLHRLTGRIDRAGRSY